MALTLYKRIDFNNSNEVSPEDIVLAVNEYGKMRGLNINRHKANRFAELVDFCVAQRDAFQYTHKQYIEIAENITWIKNGTDLLKDPDDFEFIPSRVLLVFDKNDAEAVLTISDIEIVGQGALEKFSTVLDLCDRFSVGASEDSDHIKLSFKVEGIWF